MHEMSVDRQGEMMPLSPGSNFSKVSVEVGVKHPTKHSPNSYEDNREKEKEIGGSKNNTASENTATCGTIMPTEPISQHTVS